MLSRLDGTRLESSQYCKTCYTRFCTAFRKEIAAMKAGIHPAYNEVKVTCACGHSFPTRSTHKGDIRVEICANCHPFFTGRQKLIDTEGRVDRFQKKYANIAPRGTKTAAKTK